MAHADAPSPITLVAGVTGTGLQSAILDIADFVSEGYPPVLHVWISGGAANVIVLGSGRVSDTDPPALIRGTDVSSGGYTATNFYDLIPGIRFYQINISANAGTVWVEALFGPQQIGRGGLPHLVRMTNVATAGM